MAPWERVVEVVGDLMTPMGIYPERYRVKTSRVRNNWRPWATN